MSIMSTGPGLGLLRLGNNPPVEMPDFLRSYLETLTREQAIELSAWLTRDWKEKAPHYPIAAIVEAASRKQVAA